MMHASVKGCSDLTKKTAPGRSLRRPREPLSVKARDGRLRENRPEVEALFIKKKFNRRASTQKTNGSSPTDRTNFGTVLLPSISVRRTALASVR